MPCRVKQYESKLAALNAINSALQKENDKLREELAHAQDPTTDAGARRLPATPRRLTAKRCGAMASMDDHASASTP